MTVLASTGSDALILMLCQMEYNSTVDERQYWALSSWLADLTNAGDYPESDAMKTYRGAFFDPEHPQHTIAIKLDLYRKSITDLLNAAAAQLTALYANYPRYTRLALVRRLEQRFIGWRPVDPMRISALDSIDWQQEFNPIVVHNDHVPKKKALKVSKLTKENATEEDLARILKEKQRKKALEKRKQQFRRNTYNPGSFCARLEDPSSCKSSESVGGNDDNSNGFFEAPEASLEPPKKYKGGSVDFLPINPVRSASPQILPLPEALKSTTEADALYTRSGSCDQSLGTSVPRSSLASIWTSKEQSTSTSDTSPQSSEKDELRLQNQSAYLGAPTKAVKAATLETIEYLLPIKSHQGFAETEKEEEMYAHIVRVARRRRGSEVASFMTALLPEPRPLPAPVTSKAGKSDKATPRTQTPAQLPKTAKQKRKMRAKTDQADSNQLKDLDFAGDLLYSALKKERRHTSILQQPIVTCVALSEHDDLNSEFETMSVNALRGRNFSKTR